MALDPSIILGVKPVDTQVDPLKQYTAVAQAKAQAQEMQLKTLQIQDLTRQQETHARLEKALSDATVIDPTTGKVNFDRASAVSTLKSGGLGAEAVELQDNWQKQDLQKVKDGLDITKKSLDNQALHVDAMGRFAGGVLALPPDQQAQAYAYGRAHMIQTGAITPDEAPEQYNPASMQALQAQSMKASELLTSQHQKVEENQKSVELAQTAANNEATQLIRRQENQTTLRGQNLTHADRQQGLRIEAGRLQMDQAKNAIDQGGAVELQAQQIAKGELPLPSQSRVNPLTRAVTQRALEINPQLSTNLYTTVQDYYSSKGKTNAQITTLNKLSDHLQELRKDSDKAGFSPFSFTSAGKDLRLGNQLFSNEDVKYLSGVGVAHEGELNLLRKNTMSPIASVRSSALDTLERYTADAARQTANQFTRDTRMPFDETRAFTANTRRLLSAGKQDSGAVTVTDPTGKVHSFSTQAQANHFKQIAGIK